MKIFKFNKTLFLVFIIFLQNKFVYNSKNSLKLKEIKNCEADFFQKCKSECVNLGRTLCYCKILENNSQNTNKCLCTFNKEECDKEKLELKKYI